jgi:hypothetical protein
MHQWREVKPGHQVVTSIHDGRYVSSEQRVWYACGMQRRVLAGRGYVVCNTSAHGHALLQSSGWQLAALLLEALWL